MDLDFLTHAPFWVALGQIILIDILLGGDNAVVIALACRKLPPHLRNKGIFWGTAGAIVLRVVLIAFAMALLALPFIKVVGAALLLWIGIKLIAPHEDEHAGVQSSDKLWAAVQTVIVADLVMSVDNVIAIAGAAHSAGAHQMLLVTLGLLISIPIIVLGGMLLGWIGSSMAVSDPLFVHPEQWLWSPKLPQSPLLHYGAAAAGALLVLGLGQWLKRRAEAAQTAQA